MVKFSAKSTDLKFKGVRKRKWGKWVSEIRLPNSRNRIWLGSYDSPEKAARAFDAALFCLRGRTAKFNFPDSPPEIAGARSLSPPEIQIAAAQFANSESPAKKTENCSAAETPAESPCGSVEESELAMDTPFLDLLMDSGPGNYPNDYGLFPGFDDIQDDFFVSLTDFGGENFDSILVQDSFLWDF